jgi:hypothetical protein
VLLWRRSRDGFGGINFHWRCDGDTNTPTLILDTGRNVFGDLTLLQREARTRFPYNKCDDSLSSFFTQKNPHNIPARKFALEAEAKQYAI